jgi:tRNA U34 2-thiouridine synthase MnmA/TrmU
LHASDSCTQLADSLRISFGRVDLTRQYWVKVFQDFLNGHADGGSPNPDVFCNREIKFADFLAHARGLGADAIATGHYARLVRGDDQRSQNGFRQPHLPTVGASTGGAVSSPSAAGGGIDWARMDLATWARLHPADGPTQHDDGDSAAEDHASLHAPPLVHGAESLPYYDHLAPPPQPPSSSSSSLIAPPRLFRGVDALKDQSYFLSLLRPRALDSVLFPLGALHKQQVRALARDLHLPVWDKKGSVGICFIGKRQSHGAFLEQFLGADAFAPGPIVCAQTGAELGRHTGLPRYTIGQAARLSGQPHAYFVCGKQMASGGDALTTSASSASLASPSLSPLTSHAAPPFAAAHAQWCHFASAPVLWVAPGRQHASLFWRRALVDRVAFIAGAAPHALGSPSSMAVFALPPSSTSEPASSASSAAAATASRASPLSSAPASLSGGRLFCHVQLRRARMSVPAVAQWTPDGRYLAVEFAVPQFAVTPGQALVLYRGDECLGGGIIAAADACAMSATRGGGDGTCAGATMGAVELGSSAGAAAFGRQTAKLGIRL